MPQHKYFAAITAAQAAMPGLSKTGLAPFDFGSIARTGAGAKLANWAFNAGIQPVYAFARAVRPLLRLGGMTHVVRDADVRAVLARPQDFAVPFGPEMAELAGGATFVLGLEGEAQARQNALIRRIILPADGARIATDTRRFGQALLDNSAGRIDAMRDYLTRTVTEVCIRYFGFSIDDPDAFADWTISASALLFADPFGDPKVRALALNGAVRLRAVIDDAVQRGKVRIKRYGHAPLADLSLVDRLVVVQAEQAASDPVSDAEIRAILYGLVTGFIPTNALAAGKMLQELTKRPAALRDATVAAAGGQRDVLKRILLEAGRLNPALSPGQFRICQRDCTLEVSGEQRQIKAGTLLLVSTMSAMRDRRRVPRPTAFWPDRTDSSGKWVEPDLIFGSGVHDCIGKYVAIEQITEAFLVLLAAPGIATAPGKAGKMASIGVFPRNLTMTYTSPSAQQSMFLVITPITSRATKYAVDKELAELGHPAGAAIRAALDATGVVHFASLATIASDQALHLSFELSTDGAIAEVVAEIAALTETLLRPVFRHAGLTDGEDFAAFLTRHVVELHGKPWGANGLNYNGLGEFPVRMVAKQADFADFSGRVLRDFVATETARGSHPSLAMAHLRRILRGDPALRAEATPAQTALIEEAAAREFDAFHLTTTAARLKLAQFRPVSDLKAFANFLASRDGRIVVWPVLACIAVCAYLFWPDARGPLTWQVLSTGARAVLATTLIFGSLIALFLVLLRRAETTDVPSTTQAPLEKLQAIMAQENPPGHAHNHVLAVGTMKPGWFRAFTHAFALWAIRVMIVHAFRPGLVINMGTIHYARWFRLPGTNKACFYSNFDGSWESYLEDFITRARQGQSAAWSNWQGYPRTRFLISQGAHDGDAFKRFTRNVQQLVPFWYSRFPALTSDQIRNNALIHSGASLARSATECEEWTRCFGSMPRVENRIETDEVQALVFRGMKRLPYSTALALRLPPDPEGLGEWLSWVRGRPMQLAQQGDAAQFAALIAEGVLLSVPRPAEQVAEYALAHSLTLTFGDRPLAGDSLSEVDVISTAPVYPGGEAVRADAASASTQAVFLGLSARGMARFEAPNAADGALIEGFPYAFRMGMAARAKINGDFGPDAPANWRWQDDPTGEGGSDGVLMAYASSPERLERLVQVHRALLLNHGGEVVSDVPCAPAFAEPEKADFEHFGYRDGISQPVIKGTSRATNAAPARDQLEAGEFILGYRNTTGYYPPSPLLPAEADVRGALPAATLEALSRYTDFGDQQLSTGPRDLGRNGTFLVLRELRQDVAGFEDMVDTAAQQLNSGGLCELYRLTGQSADRDWIKAKLMGRWPNGRPLVGNPVARASSPATLDAEIANDFSYGEDDPQGLACPFGAHIRRTNPRDSKQPGDPAEQVISNRHRLLRRGRTYQRPDGEKGLLFAAVCADIERQFEFVQQFWANAPSFHGLVGEPDPISGADPLDQHGQVCTRAFTIPTAVGPVRLDGLRSHIRTMGGGYFFLPSRSALGWLTDVALHAPSRPAKEPLA